ncbi:unnamed protein product [Knipowitschia caucasica]
MDNPWCLSYGRLLFLLLTTCTCPGASPHGAAFYNLSDATQHPHGNIFSPLIKALSQYEGASWNPEWRKRIKPEHKYIKYLTKVYKQSSRVQRSVKGSDAYNTVRLIKPLEESFVQNDEGIVQDLSYRLDQVRSREQLLKATLLFNLDSGHSSLVDSVCMLHIKELEASDHCTIRSALHSWNSTGGNGKNWVEINVTAFLLPFQKNSLHLFINITCEEGMNHDRQSPMLELALLSPPLLLYLSDTSKHVQKRFGSKAEQKSSAEHDELHKVIYKTKHMHRRWKRSSLKNKRDKSLKTQLPDLLPSSKFQTSDCALYDFWVLFSQLKLDHWIVFPQKYNPRYCRGICPRAVGFIYGSTVHTMVQNIIYEKMDSSVPRPSCVPLQYSPLSVMMIEEDGSYVYKEFEDMVATRCTCR